jgi:hypothetical protein
LNAALHGEILEVVLPCSKLDQLCEQGHVSVVPKPQTQLSGENRRVFISNSLKPPRKVALRAL